MPISEQAAFGYLRARIMARHSLRPTREHWQQLENCRALESFLQLARQSSLGTWVRHFEIDDDAATWERSLRRDWRGYLGQLLGWTPARWRESLVWTEVLPFLPALAGMLDGQPLPEWAQHDGFFNRSDPQDREEIYRGEAAAPWHRFLHYRDSTAPLVAWWQAWLDCWPQSKHDSPQRLTPVWGFLTHADGLQLTSLEEFFTRLLRDQQSHMLPVIAHLALLSLDLGRLRANLQHRQLRQNRAAVPA